MGASIYFGSYEKVIVVHNNSVNIFDSKSGENIEDLKKVGQYLYDMGAFPVGARKVEKEMKKISYKPEEKNILKKFGLPIIE